VPEKPDENGWICCYCHTHNAFKRILCEGCDKRRWEQLGLPVAAVAKLWEALCRLLTN
jgi:hypothetical protein